MTSRHNMNQLSAQAIVDAITEDDEEGSEDTDGDNTDSKDKQHIEDIHNEQITDPSHSARRMRITQGRNVEDGSPNNARHTPGRNRRYLELRFNSEKMSNRRRSSETGRSLQNTVEASAQDKFGICSSTMIF